MSKKVNIDARIILGGQDISQYVTRWAIEGVTGELYVAEIDIIDHPSAIEIIVPEDSYGRISNKPRTAGNGAVVVHRARVALKDRILIQGVDISRWISGYDRRSRAAELDVIRLYVQCDTEVLSINGTTPWEMAKVDA